MKVEETAKDYEGCDSCIHSYDDVELCVLRKCKHAIHVLKECYKPKEASESECKE